MFQCEAGHMTEPGDKQVKVVVESREVIYYDAYGEVVGHGHEAVREAGLCASHAEELSNG